MTEETMKERLDRLQKMADTRPDQHADSYAMALLEAERSGELTMTEVHAAALADLRSA